MKKLNFKKDSDGEKHYWVYNDDVLVELYLSEKWQDEPMYDFIKEEEYGSKEELLKDGYVMVDLEVKNDEYQTSKTMYILAHPKFDWSESYIFRLVFDYFDKKFEYWDDHLELELEGQDKRLNIQREKQRREKPYDNNNDPADN